MPSQIRASHILVKDKAEAERLLKLLKDGSKFENLAEMYSKCPSGKKGGDLGWFTRGRMVPAFEKAAFALKNTGDLSPVVQTQFGFHIIKKTGEQ